MELQISHLLHKKVDESGNIVHWFKLSKRVKGAFNLYVGFKLDDQVEPFVAKLEFKKMDYKERQERKKLAQDGYGVFSVDVPNGMNPKGIFCFAERGFRGMKTDVVEIPVSPVFQDIVEEERRFDLIFKKPRIV